MSSVLRKSVAVAVIAATVAFVAFDASAQALLLNFRDAVRAYDTDEWTQFVGAGNHLLEVIGDTDTDLDCWVTTSNGTLLGSDDDSTDHCIIRWYQPYGTRLTFHIENLGGVYNRYHFMLR